MQNGERFGLSVTYSQDGEVLLGTAGAIKKALPLLEDNFFIIYGDSYLDCDYERIQRAFKKANKLSLMTVFKNNNQGDKSNIIFKNGKIIEYDKEKSNSNMQYIDYGISIFNKSTFLNILESNFYDLVFLYKKLLINKQLAAFQVYQLFYEIGSLAGLFSFNNYLKNKNLLNKTLN